ncbi:MAG: glycosyl hydrolase, partial [Phycisphaerales bacterium]
MKSAIRMNMLILVFLFFVILSGCSAEIGANSVVLGDELSWPAVANQTRPWSRWWWMGSIVNEDDLTTEMEKYAQAGLGGLEITPIYGVRGYEDQFIDYLTPKWMEMLVHTLEEAERLDMGIDMATGNGWPFGGQWVGADDACKNVVYKTYTLSEGQSLDEPVNYMQRPMVRAIGRRLNISEIKEPISTNENLQALALEQVRFEKPLPLQILMAYSDQGQSLDLTDKVNSVGNLHWTAPVGNWTLYAVFQGWHGKMVERAGPGGEGNVIDHFRAEALENYLRKFDRAYIGYDVSSLRAYFNDSYEVDDAAGESNWTDNFFEEFRMRRGYDLRERLPALFGNDSAEKNSRVLCDYRETISDLLLERFTIPWGQWAQSKGATTRNQAHGSPANLLDLYAASGIPETEGSDRLGFKLASSAAHVTGKLLTSSEAATWLDEHFCASLGDVKTAVDGFFLGGINHICYHGTNFSPPSETWPGWMFYASVHFGPTNSFWKDFSTLNMYVTRCQSFLQAGQPDNDVLVYFPIYDSWSQTGRSLLQHFRQSVSGVLSHDGQLLLDAGHTFDFISDRQVSNLEFVNNSLQTGGVSYKAVVIPETQLIPVETFEKLIGLAQEGAIIIFGSNLPSDVPGYGSLNERRSNFEELVARLNFTETGNSDIRSAEIGRGRILVADDLMRLLSYAGIERETMVEQGLQFVRRLLPDGKCYYVVNGTNEPLDDWVPLQVDAKSVAIYEPMHGEVGLAAMKTSDSGANEVYLQLTPGESCILRVFENVIEGPSYCYVKTSGEPQKIEGTWSVTFIDSGPELPPNLEITELDSWTNFGPEVLKIFSGTAKYTISFHRPVGIVDGWMLDLGRVCESASVRLNGTDLGTLIGPDYRISIPNDIMQEDNILEIEVSNLMANRIADLDRRGVNWKKFYNI